MKVKVTAAQKISRDCLVCGVDNPLGLKARFYNLQNGQVMAVYRSHRWLQSYPGRQHGGISAAILDETIGRAIELLEPGCWGVTASLSLRYRKPVPLDVPLRVVAQVTRNSSRAFDGSGQLLLPDGTVAVTAEGRYVKMGLEQIVGDSLPAGEDPEQMMFPDPAPLPPQADAEGPLEGE